MKIRATMNTSQILHLQRVYSKDRSTILEYKHSIADHRRPESAR